MTEQKIQEFSNINELRKFLQKSKQKIILRAKDNEFNRKALETGKISMIVGLEHASKKDYSLKQRDSGLNHILAKIANQNNTAIGIEINKIIETKGKEKAQLLGRIIQNIKLCKKAGTKIIFLGKKDKHELQSLALSLGMSTQQAKEAVLE